MDKYSLWLQIKSKWWFLAPLGILWLVWQVLVDELAEIIREKIPEGGAIMYGLTHPYIIMPSVLILFSIYLLVQSKRQTGSPESNVERIPTLLNRMEEYLKSKVKKKLNKIKRGDEQEILKLNGVLKHCLAVLGVTKELPKPKGKHITERYRASIHNKIPLEIREQLLDKNRSWELTMKIGGILDRRNYGLQTEDDVKYSKYKTEVNDITKHYIGIGSRQLNKQKNDFLIRLYASYSYLLLIGYWEILVDFAKARGADNIVQAEAESFLPLKNESIERYVSEELEKVKKCIAYISKKMR